jgi:hypothetical protein
MSSGQQGPEQGPDEGIDAVIDLLTRLAAGDLEARARRVRTDETLDAVIVGVNMLAEELAANRDELEQRVADRTRELEHARLEAQAATRQKSEFLATMSHEIRTPLNGVIGLTELLLGTRLDEAQLRYVEGLRHAGDALLNVIDDILDFSKIEAGMVELEDEEVDLRRVLASVEGLMSSAARDKDLELVCHVNDGVPPAVRRGPAATDPAQLRLQRGEVHRQGHRPHRRERRRGGRRVRGRVAAAAPGGHRHRHRDPRVRPAHPLRLLHPGRRVHHPQVRRHRPRPGDLAQPRRRDGRHGRRREHGR